MPKQEKAAQNTRFAYVLLRGAVVKNPVLVQLVGLCPVFAASATLKMAALLSATFFVSFLFTQCIACLFLKKMPRFLRVAVYMLLGIGAVVAVMLLLERFDHELLGAAGIYLPLLCVHSVVSLHCEKLAVKADIKFAMQDAFATGLGYCIAFLFTGLVREYLSMGTVWGRAAYIPVKLPAFGLAFASFLVLAFFAAGLQGFTRRVFPAHAKEAALKISDTVVHVSQPQIAPPSGPVGAFTPMPQALDPAHVRSVLQDIVQHTAQDGEAAESPYEKYTAGLDGAQPDPEAPVSVDLLEIRWRFQRIMEELDQHEQDKTEHE